MTTKEEVKRIVDKYNESFLELSNNGTAKEFKTVMKYKGVRYRSVCTQININKYNEIADKETKYQKTT